MSNKNISLIKNNSNYSFKLAFLVALLLSCLSYAQEIPDEFNEKVNSLIENAPKSYKKINAEFREFKRDTNLLNFFAESAQKSNYFEGQSYALNQKGIRYRNLSQLDLSLIHI